MQRPAGAVAKAADAVLDRLGEVLADSRLV